VILRMKSLRLGAVEDFPFLERRSAGPLPTATSCWPNWARWTTPTSSRRIGQALAACRWTRAWAA
jgi:hypothetical protein